MPTSSNRRKSQRGQRRKTNAERNWRLGRTRGAAQPPAKRAPSMEDLAPLIGMETAWTGITG